MLALFPGRPELSPSREIVTWKSTGTIIHFIIQFKITFQSESASCKIFKNRLRLIRRRDPSAFGAGLKGGRGAIFGLFWCAAKGRPLPAKKGLSN